MDLYIEEQIAARSAAAVSKSRLLNLRSRFPSGLIIAVEGSEDKVAYSHWITRIRPTLAYEFLVCGGKPQVRQLKNAALRDLGGLGKDVIYLVDRDFDDLDGFDNAANVAMTDRYSIENFIVDNEVLELSLRIAYPCNGHPALREQICALFDHDYHSFLLVMKDLNFRIYVARRLGFFIDDCMPSSLEGIVRIQLGNISAVQHDAGSIITFPHEPTDETLQVLSLESDSFEPHLRYRGKFSYKFFRKWLDKLADEFRNGYLGLFALLSSEPGTILHDELGLGPLASRSPVPHELYGVLP